MKYHKKDIDTKQKLWYVITIKGGTGMDYDRIILDMLNRIVALEDKVTKLESASNAAQSSDAESLTGSKKYRFLSDYLHASNQSRVKLTYEEIEDILKFKLPESATTHRAFWANTTSHSIALSWLSVNYSVVEVNLEERYIVFEKKREFEKMTISEQMKTVVSEIISAYGEHYKISLKELYELLGARFGTCSGSIMPYDYCYDRVNKGSDFDKKPRLFRFLGDGMYECLGENYRFNGPIYAKPHGAKEEFVVGVWENGVLEKNADWDLYCLR